MYLSRIYSNKPSIFAAIKFNRGLNVVVAEIRVPENRNKNTHNLGKTTLGRVIDFCLLSGRDPEFFLIKHQAIFNPFVFFLEIELLDGSHLTIRRGVENASKISISHHQADDQDLTDLPDNLWSHSGVPFDRARSLLDGILDLRDLSPYDFRKTVGYLIREQDDFRDVFHLKRFQGPHADWKPFLAHILGFGAKNIEELYTKEEDLKSKMEEEAVVKNELGGAETDVGKIEGLLQIKKVRAEKRQEILDSFDFRAEDKDAAREVIDEIDVAISSMTNERYLLNQNKKRINLSLAEGEALFDADAAEKLFKESGIVFAGQIKKDFKQLVEFNKSITQERSEYLRAELLEIDQGIKDITEEINLLSKKRSQRLSSLSQADVFVKYKLATDELVNLKAEIAGLELQQKYLRRLQEIRAQIRSLEEEKGKVRVLVESDVSKQNSDSNSLFSKIRLLFSEIIRGVLDCDALLSVSSNKLGHLDFKAEIIDEGGKATSEDKGYSYRKLLCIAFDMAVLRAHLSGAYPRFAFHDGIFESLDDRIKANLLAVMRSYSDIGIQQIITLIDSDSPDAPDGDKDGVEGVFSESEIILRLNDLNDQGRLFKMRPW